MTQIKFGTDGWRAIIGKDFIPENVAKVIQAFCDIKQNETNKTVYIGYDRRQHSPSSARLAAQILATNGYDTYLSDTFCPTPTISWMVKDKKALAGVVITASHNPANWNGVKFKESYGGAASPEYTTEIEVQMAKNDQEGKNPLYKEYETLLKSGKIKLFDPYGDYVAHLQSYLDVSRIQKQNFKIAFDPLYGAGTDFVARTLGIDVVQIHGAADTTFGGLHPEPILPHLNELQNTVLKEKAHIGIATDGDADRIGAFTEKGDFVSAHQIFALLLLHNIRHRKMSGDVIKSISTTGLIKTICDKHKLTLIETPIGFKYISKELLERDALMGGEESGGISITDHVLERDGILNGMLLIEMMAVHQKNLSELINDMDQEFGKYHVQRIDYKLTPNKMIFIKDKMTKADLPEVQGIAPTKHETRDGRKTTFSDGSWLLVRASGTEPLLRVYAEATSLERVAALHDFAKKYYELDS